MTSFDTFIDIIHSLQDKAELEDFLMGITTQAERDAFVQRVEIVKALIAGEPQHKIAERLGVGVATVTRGSKELANDRFRSFAKRQK